MAVALDFESLSDEQYYDHLREMFNTPGWAIVIQELKDQVVFHDDVQTITDERDLYQRQGKLAQIGLLINFEDTVRRAEAEAEQEDPEE